MMTKEKAVEILDALGDFVDARIRERENPQSYQAARAVVETGEAILDVLTTKTVWTAPRPETETDIDSLFGYRYAATGVVVVEGRGADSYARACDQARAILGQVVVVDESVKRVLFDYADGGRER